LREYRSDARKHRAGAEELVLFLICAPGAITIGNTEVFTPDGLGAVYQNQGNVQVARNDPHEKLGFLVPNANVGLDYAPPINPSTSSTRTSDNATAGAPPGTVFGMHGHIPGRDDGLVDAPNRFDPYGDAQSLSLPSPFPMATIAQRPDGNYVVGVHEIVNGRLQFRAPIGALTDAQRQAIQSNLDVEQKKFYQ